jgi:hypothetical protein
MAGTGGYDQSLLAAEQAGGQASAAYAADLAVSQLTDQRNQIIQALQTGAGLLSDYQQRALTERLGMIDAQLRQQSIDNQNNQYYAGLNQNNTQFNDNLGWQMAQWQYLQNLLPFMTGQ